MRVISIIQNLINTSHAFNATILILLAALLYLPGIQSLPPIDRDEARFAQATKQMLETNNYFTIQFQNTPRHKKPPGIHHLQAATLKTTQFITGKTDLQNQIWVYRLPSLIATTLTVLLIYFLTTTLFQNKYLALLAASIFASSTLTIIEAHQATTDATLTAALTTCLATLALIYQTNSKKISLPIIFWLALAFAFYLKGPIAIIIPAVALTTLSLRDRSANLLRALHPLKLGIPIFTILTALWAIPLHRATAGSFWRDALLSDFLPKLTSGVESHAFPPGFYTVIVVLTFWPASLLVSHALLNVRKLIKSTTDHQHTPAIRLLLTWLIPMWLILEFIPTKLPHYVLPLFPALAILTALGCTKISNTTQINASLPRLAKLGFIFWAFLTVAFAITLVIILRALGQPLSNTIITPLAFAFAIAAVLSSRAACAQHFHRALAIATASTIIITITLFHTVLPQNPNLWLSRTIAQSLQILTPLENATLEDTVAVGYHEPSLVFLTSTNIQLLNARRAADYFIAHPQTATIIVDEKKSGTLFREALENQGYRFPIPIARHRGYNYTKGNQTIIHIYQNLTLDIRQASAIPSP